MTVTTTCPPRRRKLHLHLNYHSHLLAALYIYSHRITDFPFSVTQRPTNQSPCMLQSPRRRSPVIGSRKSKPPHPSPSPRRRTNNKSRPLKILNRCSSAPLLLSRGGDDVVEYAIRSEGRLFRPQTFSEAFASSPSLFASSPHAYTNNKVRATSLN